ncbi:pp2c-domain-containing protein [Phaffia rhodozyma]|uniref:protein-serine/threonine phosphatase n=1 Tax=Phaffia rhodozyma TaxID=264483 RepID=A0A0F7SQX9_PHARH|nr:pp2c-domain-containing protein [Phaffia rhodozyma]
MGQTLSEPVVEKHTDKGSSNRFAYAISEMQGWRISMEDAHATILSLPPPSSSSSTDAKHPAFFAVYDGHGGSTVAKYTGSTLHTRLSELPEYAEGNYEVAFKKAFLGTDDALRADPKFVNDPSGCTAVAVLITPDNRFICANAGDSRSVLSVGGKEEPLSHDHKPTNEKETARIVAAGGFVDYNRVNGNLALSRAVGDFEFKQNHSLDAEHQVVTVDPDIISHAWTGEEEFLVVACDGIWDCLTSQQVVDFTRRAIANGDSLVKICEDMMEKCLAPSSEIGGIGCDNMTVCIVAILGDRSEAEWREWITSRVNNKVGHDTPLSVPHVFNTAPVDRHPGASTPSSGTNPNAASASLQQMVGQAGNRVLGGMSLQEVLKGSGISFSPSGGLVLGGRAADEEDDEEEEEEEEEEEKEEGEQVSSSTGSNEPKEGGHGKGLSHPEIVNSPGSASEREDESEPTSSNTITPSGLSFAGRPTQSTLSTDGVSSVGNPKVASSPELKTGNVERG